MQKVLIALCAGVSALAFPAAAFAQSAAPRDGDVSPASDAAASAVQGIEDIVVTAQKREQRLQSVPIAINALTADQLETSGVDSIQELNILSPGLGLTRSVSSLQIVMRGLGTVNSAPGDEAIIPVYVDGIYQPSQQAAIFELTSVERIEVLKGPQGTLFGRNAVAGAINIVTEDPGQEREMRIGGTYGRYDTFIGDLYANLPITPELAVNLAARGSRATGYFKDLGFDGTTEPLGDTHAFMGRVKILWRPTPAFKLRLIGSQSNLDDTSASAVQPLDDSIVGRAAVPGLTRPTGYEIGGDVRPEYRSHQTNAAADAELTLTPFTLTGIFSYVQSDMQARTDSDGTRARGGTTVLNYKQRSYNAEVRLASNGSGPLQWLAGVFYFDNRSAYDPSLTANGTVRQQPVLTSRARAVFGELSYEVTDQLTVIGGLRYSTETVGLSQTQNGVFIGSGEDKFSAVTPRATIQYRFTPRLQVYATYSEAFKSGLFANSLVVLPFRAVRPERLRAYEAGLKSDLASNLRLNLAAYYYDYRDKQLTSVTPPNNQVALRNAAKVKAYGGEVDLTYNPLPGWSITVGAAYSHARFDEYVGAPILVANATRTGNVQQFIDASGNPLPRAPDFTASVASSYTAELGGGERLEFSANYYYASKSYWDVGKLLDQPDTHTVNASITYKPNDDMSVALLGENLTNSDRYAYKTNASTNVGVRVRPLWVGIRARLAIK